VLYELPGYTLAMTVSVAIAGSAIEMVHQLNKKLNSLYHEVVLTGARMGRQIIWGFLVPFLAIFLMATIYYWMNGMFILDTMWLDNHGITVALMLVFLNSFYIIQRFAVFRTEGMIVLSPEVQTSVSALVEEDVIVYVFVKSGGYSTLYKSLKTILNTLDKREYFLSRICIVRRDNIDFAYEKDGQIKVRLKIPEGVEALFSLRQKAVLSGYFK
jgi:hypothetical protein